MLALGVVLLRSHAQALGALGDLAQLACAHSGWVVACRLRENAGVAHRVEVAVVGAALPEDGAGETGERALWALALVLGVILTGATYDGLGGVLAGLCRRLERLRALLQLRLERLLALRLVELLLLLPGSLGGLQGQEQVARGGTHFIAVLN